MNRFEREQALAKTAITQMGECSVTPTPDNFELFYIYASGENVAIKRVLDELIALRRPIAPKVLAELRARCLPRERVQTTVEDVGKGIGDTIESVLGKLEKAGKDAKDYGLALSAASGELSDDNSPDALRKLVTGLIGATQAMETRTRALETELQRSSEQVGELKTQLDDVRKASRIDPLTNLANRKSFDTELQSAISDSVENGAPVTLMMCDIDYFKRFNDTWGHQTGDQVLRLVAACLSENVKGRDTAARYGGEEFAVILRQTGLTDALRLAEQIRSGVENKKLVKKSTGDILGTITISIGVAQLNASDHAELLVQRADTCLYRAKHSGRNRVVGELELAPAVTNAA